MFHTNLKQINTFDKFIIYYTRGHMFLNISSRLFNYLLLEGKTIRKIRMYVLLTFYLNNRLGMITRSNIQIHY